MKESYLKIYFKGSIMLRGGRIVKRVLLLVEALGKGMLHNTTRAKPVRDNRQRALSLFINEDGHGHSCWLLERRHVGPRGWQDPLLRLLMFPASRSQPSTMANQRLPSLSSAKLAAATSPNQVSQMSSETFLLRYKRAIIPKN